MPPALYLIHARTMSSGIARWFGGQADFAGLLMEDQFSWPLGNR